MWKIIRNYLVTGNGKDEVLNLLENAKSNSSNNLVRKELNYSISLLRKATSIEHLDYLVRKDKDIVFYPFMKGTAIIVANGPSLNDIPMEVVNLHPYVVMNRGYLKKELTNPFVYVAVNDLVIKQFKDEIEKYIKTYNPIAFLPGMFKNLFSEDVQDKVVWLNFLPDRPHFSTYVSPVWQGHTVTFVALQILYWMYVRKVIIVGLDHYYPDAENKPTNKKELLERDSSHFTEEYFSGKFWHTPNLKRSEEAYKLARKYYEDAGGEIINASTKTRLDIFDRMDLILALKK